MGVQIAKEMAKNRSYATPILAHSGRILEPSNAPPFLCCSLWTHRLFRWLGYRGNLIIVSSKFLMLKASKSISTDSRRPSPESALCRLTCFARETGEVFQSPDNVIDGTPCSYENSHSICIQVESSWRLSILRLCPNKLRTSQGQCQTMGCDKRLGSSAVENECGVCHGKPGDCAVASRHYSGAPRPRKNITTCRIKWTPFIC